MNVCSKYFNIISLILLTVSLGCTQKMAFESQSNRAASAIAYEPVYNGNSDSYILAKGNCNGNSNLKFDYKLENRMGTQTGSTEVACSDPNGPFEAKLPIQDGGFFTQTIKVDRFAQGKLATGNARAWSKAVSDTIRYEPPRKLQMLQLSPANESVPLGLSVQYSARAIYTDATTEDITPSVQWTSSDTAAATIDSTGLLKTLLPGKATNLTITANYDKISANTQLKIVEKSLTKIEITTKNPNLPIGEPGLLIRAVGYYSDNTTEDISSVAEWKFSNSAIAKITTSGTSASLLGLKIGTSTLTASFSGQTDTTNVTVTAAVLSKIEVSSEGANQVLVGRTKLLNATGIYSDGTRIPLIDSIDWISSGATLATVDTKGIVTGVKAGTLQISATSGGKTGTYDLVVVDSKCKPETFNITPVSSAPIELKVNATLNFQAQCEFTDGVSRDITSNVSWFVSGSAITVSNETATRGLVTALGSGSGSVTAIDPVSLAQKSQNINVSSVQCKTLRITGAKPLAKGAEDYLGAQCELDDGTISSFTDKVTWSSNKTDIVTVSNLAGTLGRINGIAPGTATVSVIDPISLKTASVDITVNSATCQSVYLVSTKTPIPVGRSEKFELYCKYSDGSVFAQSQNVSWSSSDSKFASVSNAVGLEGLVLGVAIGSAQISATWSGMTATQGVMVTDPVLDGISVTADKDTLYPDDTQSYVATGRYSDGSDKIISGEVTWAAADINLASIVSGGIVTAIKPGSVAITATKDGKTGSKSLKILMVTELKPTPDVSTIKVAGTQTYSVVATYENGTTKTIPAANLIWTSANTSIATIANGVATGVGTGQANIVVSYRDLQTGFATLNVDKTVDVTSLAISPAVISINNSQKQAFQVSATYSDGHTANISPDLVTWENSNTALMTNAIENNTEVGTASATASGSLTLKATFAGKFAVSNVTIVKSITSLTITATSGTSISTTTPTLNFSAVANYSDSSSSAVTVDSVILDAPGAQYLNTPTTNPLAVSLKTAPSSDVNATLTFTYKGVSKAFVINISSCSGAIALGGCWYVTSGSQSCDTYCAGVSAGNSASALGVTAFQDPKNTPASVANCQTVTTALNARYGYSYGYGGSVSTGAGCFLGSAPTEWHIGTSTTSNSTKYSQRKVCACMH